MKWNILFFGNNFHIFGLNLLRIGQFTLNSISINVNNLAFLPGNLNLLTWNLEWFEVACLPLVLKRSIDTAVRMA